MPNYTFIKEDICNADKIEEIFEKYDVRGVIHFAAESHVDNSIKGPRAFINTNLSGLSTYWKRHANIGWKHRINIKPDMKAAVFIIFQPMKFMAR